MAKNKKLLIALLAAALVLLGLFMFAAPTASAKQFSDVPEIHKNHAAITGLSDGGAISGYDDGTFRPAQAVNRAEAVKMVLSAKGINPGTGPRTTAFSDVNPNLWFAPYVAEAVSRKIVRGYDDGTFRPEKYITFAESIAILSNAFGAGVTPDEEGVWFVPFVDYAKSHFLFEPPDTGTQDPMEFMTRAQFAELTYRMQWSAAHKSAQYDLADQAKLFHKPANRYSVRYPKSWFVHEGGKNTTLYRPDYLNGQIWYTELYPNGALVSLSYVHRPDQTTAQFFGEMKAAHDRMYSAQNAVFKELTVGGRSALRITNKIARKQDLFISMPDGYFLALYGKTGGGVLSWYLEEEIRMIGASLQLVDADAARPAETYSIEERLAMAREMILVENKGDDVLSLFEDRVLIETDAIGAGNGPVDYFYSDYNSVTLKHERSSNVLLDLREGKTTQF